MPSVPQNLNGTSERISSDVRNRINRAVGVPGVDDSGLDTLVGPVEIQRYRRYCIDLRRKLRDVARRGDDLNHSQRWAYTGRAFALTFPPWASTYCVSASPRPLFAPEISQV